MKHKKLMFSALCLIFSATSVFTQLKAVSEAEYDEVNSFWANSRKVSRIETNLTNNYAGEKIESTKKVVSEILTPERYKSTFSEIKTGETKITLEIIRYDKREFRRENEGDWKEIDRSGGGMILRGGKELPNFKQYAVGESTLEEKPVRLYSFYRVYDMGTYLNFYEEFIYVNSEGLVIKDKSRSSNMFPSNTRETSEMIIEYHPKDMKIEIPKAAQIEKQ